MRQVTALQSLRFFLLRCLTAGPSGPPAGVRRADPTQHVELLHAGEESQGMQPVA